MKKPFLAAMGLVVSLAASGSASASSSAWWVLCDWCETDSAFQHQALNAPGNYTPIYVTNRDTNETRKYDRSVIINDLWGGVQQTVIVTLADFSAAVKAVFEQAVQNANVIAIRIPRNDLAGLIAGFGQAGSTAGDISNGYISNGLVNALNREVERRNLLPTHTQVNVDAGLTTPIAGANYGQGSTIRVRNLTIDIMYEDGSTITVTRRANDGKLVHWFVVDAQGNEIPLEDPVNGTSINAAAFEGRDFYFGGDQHAVLGVIDFINRSTALVCTVNTSAIDGIEIMTVRCSRP